MTRRRVLPIDNDTRFARVTHWPQKEPTSEVGIRTHCCVADGGMTSELIDCGTLFSKTRSYFLTGLQLLSWNATTTRSCTAALRGKSLTFHRVTSKLRRDHPEIVSPPLRRHLVSSSDRSRSRRGQGSGTGISTQRKFAWSGHFTAPAPIRPGPKARPCPFLRSLIGGVQTVPR